jgi:anti-sigma factor RsiW
MHGDDEELLSAFHDGELHGDERTAVERMLAEAPAARESLDELTELRGMLQALPRPAAPAELRQSVMGRIHAALPVAANAHRRRRRPSITWILSTTACAVIVGGIYVVSRPEAPRLGGDFAATDSLDYTPAPMTAPTEAAAPGPRSAADRDAVPPPMGLATTSTEVVVPQLNGEDLERLRRLIAGGELPVPGELIPDFREIGDQLVLIEYSVVDVQNVYGQVQVVLSRNGIVPVTADGELGAARDDLSGELYGIYIDAPSETFVKVLQQLDTVDGVVAVSTTSREEAERIVAMTETDTATAADAPAGDAGEAADSVAPPPPQSARNNRAPANAVFDSGEGAGTEPGAAATADARESPGQSAYQLPVTLLRDRVSQLQTAEQSQASREQLLPADAAAEPPDESPRDTSDAERVRVVLVLVPRAGE